MPLVIRFTPLQMVLAAFLFLWVVAPANGHFQLNLNIRILHVEHLQDGLRVYLRMPMPYLVADRLGLTGADGLPEPAPFTTNQMEGGALVHYVDFDQVRERPLGLGAFAAAGFRFDVNGKLLVAVVEDVRIHRVGSQPDYATLDEARAAFAGNQVYPAKADPVYVGDVVVDVILHYRHDDPVYTYAVSSSLDPGLPGQESTTNLILDYSPGSVEVFRARGLLSEPIVISRSALSAVGTFIKEGIRHILGGLDHVLFILCLVLGATRLKSLFWRVTGFTIGHTITLSAGFFGFVPSGAWFVPTVEASIALSIIYAAAIAVFPRFQSTGSGRKIVIVTSAIGLLHGLGFSFVLQNILQVTSPDIWQSLLAFNVGVEIGQVLIVVVAWLLFYIVRSLNEPMWKAGRWFIAAACASVALFWTVQRVLSLV